MSKPVPITSTNTAFVNAMRLNARHWLLTALLVTTAVLAIPQIWKRIEHFETDADYRIPYSLSKDYWLYQRRLDRLASTNIVLIGDSVIWGEYVAPDGALPHFMNVESGRSNVFINAGVNGLFPLALEGLVNYYAKTIHDRKVILHCNVLWMSSPSADLSSQKEERFNHAALVPQFSPQIPCYKARLEDKLSAVVERHFGFNQWVTHLQNAYFEQKSIPRWTLDEAPGDPPRYPNAYRNPLAQISMSVPVAPQPDPERSPNSTRHKPWSTTGTGSTRFEWVPLDRSLQWQAFQRLVSLLQSRNNDVFVIVGPFNEHFMAAQNQAVFRQLRDGINSWLNVQKIPHIVPDALPSNLYADASHPLTDGYQLLAKQILADKNFQSWITSTK